MSLRLDTNALYDAARLGIMHVFGSAAVLLGRHELKVCWPHARVNLAKVIPLHSFRRAAVEEMVRLDKYCAFAPTIDREVAVSSRVCSPYPDSAAVSAARVDLAPEALSPRGSRVGRGAVETIAAVVHFAHTVPSRLSRAAVYVALSRGVSGRLSADGPRIAGKTVPVVVQRAPALRVFGFAAIRESTDRSHICSEYTSNRVMLPC